MTICHKCKYEWTALGQAHCTVCHRHFSTNGIADRHRVGSFEDDTRRCVDPATVVKQDGTPHYRQDTLNGQVLWRSSDRMPDATFAAGDRRPQTPTPSLGLGDDQNEAQNGAERDVA